MWCVRRATDGLQIERDLVDCLLCRCPLWVKNISLRRKFIPHPMQSLSRILMIFLCWKGEHKIMRMNQWIMKGIWLIANLLLPAFSQWRAIHPSCNQKSWSKRRRLSFIKHGSDSLFCGLLSCLARMLVHWEVGICESNAELAWGNKNTVEISMHWRLCLLAHFLESSLTCISK